MKRFTDLYLALDSTTRTTEKISLLVNYFKSSTAQDSIWALYFLSGRRFKSLISTKKIRAWSLELIGLPEWLFEDCYEAVGDLAETIALLMPQKSVTTMGSLHEWIENKLLALRNAADNKQKEIMVNAWQSLTLDSCFIWNKLIMGNFRVGMSHLLVIKAIANLANLPENVIAHRLMGSWVPNEMFWHALINPLTLEHNHSRPYPFYLAYPLTEQISDLGNIHEWQIEWKWDGIRAQIIKRQNEIFIWSRGEELINEKFPELINAAQRLPNEIIIDGEILPWQSNQVANFAQLQRRISRKNLTKKILEDIPVIFLAFDILEHEGKDIRNLTLSNRRILLESTINYCNQSHLKLSPILKSNNWNELSVMQKSARSHRTEGLMLKYLQGYYLTGRKRGEWWKWKIDPYTIDAVLVAAQRGHGRRSSLYTDYTFAIWAGKVLVPLAKAYSGLTDSELHQIDAFIRHNTLQRFGPVRTVKPILVFELAFEGIQQSTRHKSGFAVRFPRILRQRLDKTAEQADNIDTLTELFTSHTQQKI